MTEKLRDDVYQTRDEYGQLLLHKEPRSPSDVVAQKNEIECLILLSKSKHVVRLRSIVMTTIPCLTDSKRCFDLVVRRGSLEMVLDEEPLSEWQQRVRGACGSQKVYVILTTPMYRMLTLTRITW